MKRFFKSLMLIAVAAMAFDACQNTTDIDDISNVAKEHRVSFKVSQSETRITMAFNGNIANFDWEEEDCRHFHIFENGFEGTDYDNFIDNKKNDNQCFV